MLLFHLRMALKSFRRTPFYTLTAMFALGLGVATFVTARSITQMGAKYPLPRTAGLVHVQLDRARPLLASSNTEQFSNMARLSSLLLPWRDARAVLGSGIPARETATFASRVVLQPEGQPPGLVRGRYCTRDHFAMFELGFTEGGPWASEEGRELVLGPAAAQRLFGSGPATGRTVTVEGESWRVSGVLAEPATARVYDLGLYVEDFEEVFLPFAAAARYEPAPDLFSSSEPRSLYGPVDVSFVLMFAELPDDAARASYEEHLRAFVASQAGEGRAAPPMGYRLRSARAWLNEELSIRGAFEVWMMSAWLVLGACTLNAARMLLAKFSSRASEVGVQRVFGASRVAVFTQHFLEALLLGVAGGFLGLALAAGLFPLLQMTVPEVKIHFGIDVNALVVTFGCAAASAALAGLYPAWRVSRIPPAAYVRRA